MTDRPCGLSLPQTHPADLPRFQTMGIARWAWSRDTPLPRCGVCLVFFSCGGFSVCGSAAVCFAVDTASQLSPFLRVRHRRTCLILGHTITMARPVSGFFELWWVEGCQGMCGRAAVCVAAGTASRLVPFLRDIHRMSCLITGHTFTRVRRVLVFWRLWWEIPT